MAKVRALVEIGLAKRAEAKIKVRQPLQSFTHSSTELTPELEEIIKDELNVKEIKKAIKRIEGDDASADASTESLDTEITPALRKEGAVRDLIRAIQQERKNKDLNPQDSIDIICATTPEIETVIKDHSQMIEQAVQAKGISFVAATDGTAGADSAKDGAEIASGTAVDFFMDAAFDPTTDTVRFIIKA